MTCTRARPAFVFCHGINQGPRERANLAERVENVLAKGGVRDCFGGVHVARWRSLGNFVGDLEDLATRPVRRDEALEDVALEIDAVMRAEEDLGHEDGLWHSVIVAAHSMGQPFACMALRLLAEKRRHPVRVSLLTLGGPLGNGLVRPYFYWVPASQWAAEPALTMDCHEWHDVWNPDDPVCGGRLYRSFLAARSHRLDYPGVPGLTNPFAEHSSYFEAPLVFDLLRGMTT
jgi:hypothetical protein